MKRILFNIYILVICLSYKSQAQFLIGPQLGYNVATLTGTSFDVTSKPGWHGGIFCSIPLAKQFSIMPSLLYSTKGFQYNYTTTTTIQPDSTLTETGKVNATLGYLDIPILLTYFTSENKGLMIQIGPQFSYLLSDNSTVSSSATVSTGGMTPQATTPRNTNSVSFNKSDVAIIGGLGYKFPQLLIIYARVSTGLSKAQQEGYLSNTDFGHNLVFEAGGALSFGAK